jgi:site-specific DNA-cytosine methylase
MPPVYPRPVPGSAPTLREALNGLTASVDAGAHEQGTAVAYLLKYMRPGMTGNEVIKAIAAKTVPMPSDAEGDFAKKWRKKLPTVDSYFSLVRLAWNDVVPTIQAAHGPRGVATSHIHPEEMRKLSIAELKRVGTFPDDFALTGDFAQQWERVGRAVPPWMLRRLAWVMAYSLRWQQSGRTGEQMRAWLAKSREQPSEGWQYNLMIPTGAIL